MRSGYNLFMSKHYELPMYEKYLVHERYDAIGKKWRHLDKSVQKMWNDAAMRGFDDIDVVRDENPSLSYGRERRSTSKRMSGQTHSDRPLTGYQLFVRLHYNLRENKDLDKYAIFKHIANEWRSLTESEKERFKDAAKNRAENVKLADFENVNSLHPHG
jgi:hypothetical protein